MLSEHPLNQLRVWKEFGLIRPLDYQFAASLKQHLPEDSALYYLAALTSNQLASGNVCLPREMLQSPEQYWEPEIAEVLASLDLNLLFVDQVVLGDGTESGREPCPLILDCERYYLFRYWQFECFVSRVLINRTTNLPVNKKRLAEGIKALFQPPPAGTVDWQAVAAAVALRKPFSVISGGPGTGKTTTVIKLLALYLLQKQELSVQPVIRLVAPTGKAAARLSESISGALDKLTLSAELSAQIPTAAATLHRLLGVLPDRVGFRHNRENPLHLDLLVVDEASMIDLPMMARLFQALPEHAQIVFLGDRDQLASVEAGSVLADICNWQDDLYYSEAQKNYLLECCQHNVLLPSAEKGTIADNLSLLKVSYRFAAESGIGRIARAVNSGECHMIRQLLQQQHDDLVIHSLGPDSYQQLIDQVCSFYSAVIKGIQQGDSPTVALQHITRFQLLAALRSGPYGVEELNEKVRKALVSRGLIRTESAWFPGRPVMVTRNDRFTGLFNGDIGIALPDEQGVLKVWFEQQGEIQAFLPSRLPEHESVFAMTVHKSQGSEFTEVALLLPPEDHPLLTRELVYTGITRAREQLHIYARERLLEMAAARITERAGGLVRRLWSGDINQAG